MTVNTQLALGYAAACIHGSEGFRATAYLDRIAKPQIWTIGYGTTLINGNPVRRGDVCTKAQAERWSAQDMSAAMAYVMIHADVPLNDWQVASLTSLCYNIGMGHYRDSTVVAALNEGHYWQAANCFLEYDHAGGKRIPGLTARRERERLMFLRAPPGTLEPTVIVEASADDLNARELDKLKGTSNA